MTAIKIGFVFDQASARQIVQIIDAAKSNSRLQRLAQHQVFLYGYR